MDKLKIQIQRIQNDYQDAYIRGYTEALGIGKNGLRKCIEELKPLAYSVKQELNENIEVCEVKFSENVEKEIPMLWGERKILVLKEVAHYTRLMPLSPMFEYIGRLK